MKREAFIAKYSPFVSSLVVGTGIFPQTVFSQAIVESQGKDGSVPGTALSVKYKNLFGIKDFPGDSWTGKYVNMSTGEVFAGKKVTVKDPFRVYDSYEDSFMDYVKFLTSNPRYKNALKATTFQQQAAELQKAGYATNPGYASLLTSVGNSISKFIKTTNPALLIGGVAAIGLLIYFSISNSND